jgi:malate dehydrogenase (oxaloacetate-decarboxylating)(NADP+)
VQFEDFANHNAFRLLRRYRDRVSCFNDDIQGTASVAVAGILSALRVTGKTMAEQTFLCLGAGEAATGISDLLVNAMIEDGFDAADARARCWMVDSKGLVVASRGELAEHKRPYAHAHAPVSDFIGAVQSVRPTAIIGVGAVRGTFTEEVVREMSRINERPIIFALSNPTSKAECTAQQAYAWSDGRALFASGSPFDAVTLPDGRHFVPRQGNNSYIFPGLGLALVVVGATRVTDTMFLAAARTLARCTTQADLDQGSLFPPLRTVRDVSARIAVDVAEIALRDGLASIERPEDLEQAIRAEMYDPRY